MNSSKTTRIGPLLGTALILFVLGLGNIYFGTFRAAEYRELLKQNQKTINSHPRAILPLVDSPFDRDTETEHINRLTSRINYYDLVALGGRIFLALSGVLLLFFLIGRKTGDNLNETG